MDINQQTVVDLNGLSELLKIPRRTLEKRWRQLGIPHIFVGFNERSDNIRFIVPDVLEFFRRKGKGYDGMERDKGVLRRSVDVQIQASEKTVLQAGLPDKTGGGKGRKRKTDGIGKPADKYNLKRFMSK